MSTPPDVVYRRGIRPVTPESFPRFVEDELSKIEAALAAIVRALAP